MSTSNLYSEILKKIDFKAFNLPLVQDEKAYFPDFIKENNNKWIEYYERNFKPLIDDGGIINTTEEDIVLKRIRSVSENLNYCIEEYYKGNLNGSYLNFKKAIEESYFSNIKPMVEIKAGYNFYRSRPDEGSFYKKRDLFHVGFENRHLIKTQRYSIPGLPALYMGDSTYVCWEEFDKLDIGKLWFTRLQNQKDLNIIAIQRIEDLIFEIGKLNEEWKMTFLLRYFVLFPIILYCSVKVKNTKGVFKPEYIIPQFLTHYISESSIIDGIKYFSTKVDYSKLKGVPAYNYVFPVRKIKNEGYCKDLIDTFYLTEPTSIEIENTLFNPENLGVVILNNDKYIPDKTISFVEGDERDYNKTSFGRIENLLSNPKRRKLDKLDI